MPDNTGASKIIRSYLDKQEYTAMPSRTLAKVLLRDNPVVFPTFEHARDRVRYVRGSHGATQRSRITGDNKKYTWESLYADLPEAIEEKHEPLTLPYDNMKYLVLADLHIPFQDNDALYQAMEYGHKHNCNGMIVAGDLADFYTISRFLKNPTETQLSVEKARVSEYIRMVAGLYKRVVYLEGNHELRWRNYFYTNAPAMVDITVAGKKHNSIETVLGIDKHKNVRYVGGGVEIRHGALNITHGHEYGKGSGSPANPARGVYLKTGECTIAAHFHRTSEHVDKTIRERYISCWTLGCLCQMHPEFARKNKWNHGLGILETEGQEFEFTNKKLIKGKVV